MRRLLALICIIAVFGCGPAVLAQNQQNAEETEEEEPYDERGWFVDSNRISLSFTKGSTDRYDYDDLRIYTTTDAHWGLKGDDYVDLYLLIDKLDRSYANVTWDDQGLREIVDFDFTYVFGGVDKQTYGLHHVVAGTLFSDEMWDNMDLGLGYGLQYNYKQGDFRLMGGAGRNIGFHDDWSPLADLSWTHTQRFSRVWTLRTKADWMWQSGREEDAESLYLLDGTLSYQVMRGWNIYVRYFDDNTRDRSRSYISVGLSHNYRRRVPRR